MRIRALAVAVVALAVVACHHDHGTASTPPAGATQTLFDRLGGTAGVDALIESFVAIVGADPRMGSHFVNADVPHLKQMLKAQLCANAGGPCTYTGKDMKTAHAGMHIQDADIDALLEDFAKAADKAGVSADDKRTLLASLGSYRAQIVEPAATGPTP